MSVLSNTGIRMGASGAGGGDVEAYQVANSLRFNSDDSAYLNWTPSSAGDRKTFTYSAWVKRCTTATMNLFGIVDAATQERFQLSTTNSALVYSQGGQWRLTDGIFIDLSAWYHVVCAVDTDAGSSDRIKIYINGVRQTLSGTEASSGHQFDFNNTVEHRIGSFNDGSNNYHWANYYLADVHFVDGQQLDPTSFAEEDEDTGQWVPIEYTGSYGTNGFYLKFDNTSDLGEDSSGNGNDWTANNFSTTAGAGNDVLADSPTTYDDSGNGVGNYATLNPLDQITGNGIALVNGNLDATLANAHLRGTIAIPSSGKWYFESTIIRLYSSAFAGTCGIVKQGTTSWSGVYSTTSVDAPGIYKNSSRVETISGISVNDVFGVAINMDSLSLQIYKNGSTFGAAVTIDAATYLPNISGNGNNTGDGVQVTANFGQRPFDNLPTGYKALNTYNLPDPTIDDPSLYFDVATDTGANILSTATGLTDGADFVWIKDRANTDDHILFNRVTDTGMDGTPHMRSNEKDTESTCGTYSAPSGNSVGWVWNAGSSTASNTDGTITSSVRANPTAGFSIATYSEGSSGATVGHGLGAAPDFIVVKSRDNTKGWICYHSSLGKDTYFYLNINYAPATAANYWGSSTPNSTVFGVSNNGYDNNLGDMVAFSWSEVEGYSKFGSYEGNGSADGPYVHLGFRPTLILTKNADTGGTNYDWCIYDNARSTFNPNDKFFCPNLNHRENYRGDNTADNARDVDFLSNGFKIRNGSSGMNKNTDTILYCAWAESPFKYSNAI